MRLKRPVQGLLMQSLCLACLCLACGQKQNLQSMRAYPEVQRVVTTPKGFEVWFNPSRGHKATLWIINEAHEGHPLHFETTNPITIPTGETSTRLRYAYRSGHGVDTISPAITLRRVSEPDMPLINCTTTSQSTHIKSQWSGATMDQSERVFVRQDQKILAVLSTEQSSVSLPSKGTHFELEYENQRFRSDRWRLNCP